MDPLLNSLFAEGTEGNLAEIVQNGEQIQNFPWSGSHEPGCTADSRGRSEEAVASCQDHC